MHICPICGYDRLDHDPHDELGTLCPSCGFEFGYDDDDQGRSFEGWRKQWIEDGMHYGFSKKQKAPQNWNPKKQLLNIGIVYNMLEKIKTYTCSVCGFSKMETNPFGNYGFCPCCKFEFHYHDNHQDHSFEDWRNKWIKEGMKWQHFSGNWHPPKNWDPRQQLLNIGVVLKE